MKVAGLSSVSNPYIRARWSAVSENCPQYNLHHIEFGKRSNTYQWEPVEVTVPYTRVILCDRPSQYQSLSQISTVIRQMLKALSALNPDVIVLNGYQQPPTLAALVWGKLKGKNLVLLSESKEDDAPRKWFSEAIKKLLISFYHSALVGGEKHKDYLVKLGMNQDAIFLGHNIVGNDSYAPDKLQNLPHPQETNKPYFLAINRFITKKNISTILDAYAKYRQTHNEPWDLILCGNGELRSQIESQIKTLNIGDHVHLTGFLQPEQLLPYFAHAQCFVHASTQEQWGLVVNEAMAAGLPVIVSRCCGCFEELVIEGVNGFGFEANEPTELAQLMQTMSAPDTDLAQMKQAALRHISQFSPELFSQGLAQAVEHASSARNIQQ